MIPAADRWGPFATDLDPAEQRARLRALRALVRVITGPRGAALAETLRQAETDSTALEPALQQLASLDRRAVLASFAALHRPAA